MIADGAEYSHIGLPEDVERRLRFAAPTVAPKLHGGKKKRSSSEQVCRRKEFDDGQKNVAQPARASDQSVTLVFIYQWLSGSFN